MARAFETECGRLTEPGLITFEQIGDALTSEWLPAWVQAVGSILAVLAAGALLIVQHELEHRASMEAERRDAEKRWRSLEHWLAALGLQVEGTLNTFSEELAPKTSGAWRGVCYSRLLGLKNFQGFAERFDIASMSDFTVWLGWGLLLRDLQFALDSLQAQIEWAKTLNDHGVPVGDRRDDVSAVLFQLRESVAILKEAVSAAIAEEAKKRTKL